MAAPPKPWERATGVNQRQPTFNPDQTNSFVTTPTHMNQVGGSSGVSDGGGGGGGGRSMYTTQRPPVPQRPTTYGTISRPSFGYGGYGTYGSSPYYSGGIGGMGTYGSFGNYGYNRYGMQGVPQDENGFIQAAEESSRQAFQSIESIVHAFGSVSMMLESTYHAVHSSFRAVLGVAEHFSRMKSHFAQIFSAFAVVRTLRWIYRKLLYLIGLRRMNPSMEAAWQAAGPALGQGPLTEDDLKASRSSWPIVMFLAVVFGGPYLIWRLLSSLSPIMVPKASAWAKGEGEHYAAVAAYPFQAGNQKELSFNARQQLYLAPKSQQPNLRGWLLASNGQRSGLVPANYIKILGLRQGTSQTPSSQPSLPSSRPQGIPDSGGRVVPAIANMPPTRFPTHPPNMPSTRLPTHPPNMPPTTLPTHSPNMPPTTLPEAAVELASLHSGTENLPKSNEPHEESLSRQWEDQDTSSERSSHTAPDHVPYLGVYYDKRNDKAQTPIIPDTCDNNVQMKGSSLNVKSDLNTDG